MSLRSLIAVFIGCVACAQAVPVAFAPLVSSTTSPQANSVVGGNDVLIGSLAGMAGYTISITKIGIGGDSDATSGDNRFRALGGGIDFTWVAGVQATPATHRLAPTPVASANGRGFSYADVSYMAAAGASVSFYWDYHFDYDGRYTQGTDVLGNVYNDAATPNSIRAWVQYEYISTNPNAVPEGGHPALMLGTCFAAIMTLRRRRD